MARSTNKPAEALSESIDKPTLEPIVSHETSSGIAIELGTSTALVTQSETESDVLINTQLVSIIAIYPSDYKGVKYMIDGKTYNVGHSNAERLVNELKIAKFA